MEFLTGFIIGALVGAAFLPIIFPWVMALLKKNNK